MSEVFKLPGSSYEELRKIIHAYSKYKVGKPVSLDMLAQSTGLGRTIVSSNNGFLIQVGLIIEGKVKSPTEGINKLGSAYELEKNDEVERIWSEIIENNEFLSRMISAIRIRNGMDRPSLVNHIIYSSGQKATKRNKAGAGAIIEIFKYAGLISDFDDKILVKKTLKKQNDEAENIVPDKRKVTVLDKEQLASTGKIQIILNVNINTSTSDLDVLTKKIKSLIEELNK